MKILFIGFDCEQLISDVQQLFKNFEVQYENPIIIDSDVCNLNLGDLCNEEALRQLVANIPFADYNAVWACFCNQTLEGYIHLKPFCFERGGDSAGLLISSACELADVELHVLGIHGFDDQTLPFSSPPLSEEKITSELAKLKLASINATDKSSVIERVVKPFHHKLLLCAQTDFSKCVAFFQAITRENSKTLGKMQNYAASMNVDPDNPGVISVEDNSQVPIELPPLIMMLIAEHLFVEQPSVVAKRMVRQSLRSRFLASNLFGSPMGSPAAPTETTQTSANSPKKWYKSVSDSVKSVFGHSKP